MLRLKKVAVTGGLACGKSSICQFFEQFGAYLVSADTIVHELLSSHSKVGKQVIKLLGTDIVKEGQIDRQKIASRVFKDNQILRALEELLHPAVRREIEERYEDAQRLGSCDLFVAEVPLLYEAHLEDGFDAIVAVTSRKELCMERYKQAGRGTAESYEQRALLQLPPEKKAARADLIVTNNGTLQDLYDASLAAFEQLRAA